MSTIKISNVEVSVEDLKKVVKEHPELLEEKKERPLGGDFSMLRYLKCLNLRNTSVDVHKKNGKRLNALIKIWAWKEENDGAFGEKELFNTDIGKYFIYYNNSSKEISIYISYSYLENTELPYFSSRDIAKKALKELEAEYKIVFNVA